MAVSRSRKLTVVLIVVALCGVFVIGFLGRLPVAVMNPNNGGDSDPQPQVGVAAVGNIVQTSDNGFAVTGTLSNGSIMVLKLNASKAVEWQKTYGSGAGNAITVSADGGLVVAAAKCTFEGNMGWLFKTDSTGNLMWTKDYDTAGFVGIANTNDGYVLLGSLNVNGIRYATLTKVDLAGNVEWSHNYSSSQATFNALGMLVATSDGGFAATGQIQYQIYNITMQNGWFLKVDTNGEAQINRPFSLQGWTTLNAVAETSDGFLLVGATSNSSSAPYASCIIKTDSDGHSLSMQINQTATNPTDTKLEAIAKVASDKYITSGYEEGTRVVLQEMSVDGQLLSDNSFTLPTQTHSVHGQVIGTLQGSYLWVGYSGGSIWLYDGTLTSLALPATA